MYRMMRLSSTDSFTHYCTDVVQQQQHGNSLYDTILLTTIPCSVGTADSVQYSVRTTTTVVLLQTYYIRLEPSVIL